MQQIGNLLVHGHKPMYQARNFGTGPGQAYQFEHQPHPGLMTDPLLTQAAAEQQFSSFQFNNGRDVFKKGIETAAEQQNLLAYEEMILRQMEFSEYEDPMLENSHAGYPPVEPILPHDPFPRPKNPRAGMGGY